MGWKTFTKCLLCSARFKHFVHQLKRDETAPAWSGKPLPGTTLQRQLVVKSGRPDVYARLSEYPKYSNVSSSTMSLFLLHFRQKNLLKGHSYLAFFNFRTLALFVLLRQMKSSVLTFACDIQVSSNDDENQVRQKQSR